MGLKVVLVDRDEMVEDALANGYFVQEMLILQIFSRFSLSLSLSSAFEYSPIFAMRPVEWPRSSERGLHFDKEG